MWEPHGVLLPAQGIHSPPCVASEEGGGGGVRVSSDRRAQLGLAGSMLLAVCKLASQDLTALNWGFGWDALAFGPVRPPPQRREPGNKLPGWLAD